MDAYCYTIFVEFLNAIFFFSFFSAHCVLRLDWLLTFSPVPNAFILPHLHESSSLAIYVLRNFEQKC